MRPRGLEPPPSCPDQNLNLARLPIPPRAHMVDINRILQTIFQKFGRHLVDIDVFERFFEDFKSSGNARKPLILLGFWGIDRPPDPVSRVLVPESSASANSAIPACAKKRVASFSDVYYHITILFFCQEKNKTFCGGVFRGRGEENAPVWRGSKEKPPERPSDAPGGGLFYAFGPAFAMLAGISGYFEEKFSANLAASSFAVAS